MSTKRVSKTKQFNTNSNTNGNTANNNKVNYNTLMENFKDLELISEKLLGEFQFKNQILKSGLDDYAFCQQKIASHKV